MISNFSLYWRISGGDVSVHHAAYYFLTFVFAVIWMTGVLITEASFRKSIDAVRIRRARTTPESTQTKQTPNKVMRWLRKLGLDIFAPRLVMATTIVVGLFILKYVIDKAFFYLLLG